MGVTFRAYAAKQPVSVPGKGWAGAAKRRAEAESATLFVFWDEKSPLIASAFRELGGGSLGNGLEGTKGTSRARVTRYYKEFQ